MENFKESIIPENYFLTKSMEFTRSKTSGTLWYLKKYLVLYYNIFLTDGISTEEGIRKIIDIFEGFIESLPEESKADASKLFFPDKADIRSNYNKFVDFKGNVMFTNKTEENNYIDLVKKFYFVYLMGIGGQNGVNKYVKEQLYKKDFCMVNIKKVIGHYSDEQLDSDAAFKKVKRDYHSALRNERQILCYYGFLHSKSAGSADSEFSSLTPVGEAALEANYDEFRIVWEHQKLKMISQPVTVSFSGIEKSSYAIGEKFAINYSPYVTILNYLYDRGSISGDEYQFIISRINNNNMVYVKEKFDELISDIKNIKEYVGLFKRKADLKQEDFMKELKKYILGIRSDMKKDYNKNIFGICSYRNGIVLNNEKSLERILSVYNQVDRYKIKKHEELFKSCEDELKTKYTSKSQGKKYMVNAKTKINWDLYNIHLDKVIILSIILTEYILKNDIDIEEINLKNEEIKIIKNNYSRLLNKCNLSKIQNLTSTLKMVSMALANNDLENLKVEEEMYEYTYINEFANLDVSDLKEKIRRTSEENVSVTYERIRSTKLINLIKALYNSMYSDKEKLIKCECCGKTTFLTIKDEAYLEYHHLLPFNIVDGPDHYINIFGICPDCHRRIHYGKEQSKEEMYNKIDKNNHLKKTIFERFQFLYNEKILKSYQLEYALAEHIINETEYKNILD